MRNPTITNDNYNIELPLSVEEIEVHSSWRQLHPIFNPYDNRQIFVIFDVQDSSIIYE